MRKSIKIFSAFILSLSQMFCLLPKDEGSKQNYQTLMPFNPGVKHSFMTVWDYFAKAVKDVEKL